VTWQKSWESLKTDNKTELTIRAQITKTRQAVLSNIDKLE